ncbi:cilia- and flagella-associated protein 97-like [Penaeus chinensis]|uniref:cilia- and flagella-associated protein 97-like n=1 Tax=Penaeus chinensis TaxID=139456 RepID=UPI001FB7BD78|nr:cilia- and flagella-associated protein 97-like [Penaeus chinensis]
MAAAATAGGRWLAGDSYNTRVRGSMAHKIGLNDTQYEPDIRGEVDFGFFDSDDELERTKGSEMVSGSARLSSVLGASSPGARSGLLSRCAEDASSPAAGPSEGQRGAQEAARDEDRRRRGRASPGAGQAGSASSPEAEAEAMERVDPGPYSSDEWEESAASDTDGDHSDSSDDDDPKSQVDRLIERGALMYMDGENSNLSSETDSSDSDSSYGCDSDSESDITDVSPLISATASPLGLSPVLPRRTLGTSPLALHDNRDLALECREDDSPGHDQGYDSQPHCNGYSNSDDSTDMTLLLKAVVELERKQQRNRRSNGHHQYHGRQYHNQQYHLNQPTSPVTIHPIDASPHHSHLRGSHHRRKNMSFSNDEVRRIDRENQILLHKIMSAHNRSRQHNSSNQNSRSVHRPANSTVTRRREDEKIRRENMILLRKIQEAKPSRDVTASRPPRHRTTHGLRPPSSLPTTPGSCGASARTAPGHVNTPTPRKETAL